VLSFHTPAKVRLGTGFGISFIIFLAHPPPSGNDNHVQSILRCCILYIKIVFFFISLLGKEGLVLYGNIQPLTGL